MVTDDLNAGPPSSALTRIIKPLPLGRPTSLYQAVDYYAGKTGGRLVNIKDDDYRSAFEEVIGDIVGRYQVGFVPNEKLLDGKFHKLTVRVSPPDGARARDLEVRHRSEYSAQRSPNQGAQE